MVKINKYHEPTRTQVRAIAHAQKQGEEALRGRAETIGELKDEIIELRSKIAQLLKCERARRRWILIIEKENEKLRKETAELKKVPWDGRVLDGADLSEMVANAGISISEGADHPDLTQPELARP